MSLDVGLCQRQTASLLLYAHVVKMSQGVNENMIKECGKVNEHVIKSMDVWQGNEQGKAKMNSTPICDMFMCLVWMLYLQSQMGNGPSALL